MDNAIKDIIDKTLELEGLLLLAQSRAGSELEASVNRLVILKKEEVYTTTYYTFEEAKSALFEYIESFYNRKWRHSALDYKTPQQVEDEALAA